MNGALQREGLRKLDWLVVRDFALDRDGRVLAHAPEIERGEVGPRTSPPRSSSSPPPRTPRRTAASPTRSGCCSGTTRPSSRRATAAASCDFIVPPRAAAEGAVRRLDRPEGPADPATSPGTTRRTGATRSPMPRRCCARSTATRSPTGKPVGGFTELKDDGSTACGCWIYSGCYAGRREPDGAAQAAARAELGGAGVGLGVAGEPAPPVQPRLGRSRGQALVGAQEVRLVGRGADASGPGYDVPDFIDDRAAVLPAAAQDAHGHRRPSRGDRSVHHATPTARRWLFAPSGLQDGPLPTHYEPQESVVAEPALRAAVQSGAHGMDAARTIRITAPWDDPRFPYVLTTYRLTEHHTAGGMIALALVALASCSRRCSARSRRSWPRRSGLANGGWATITHRARRDRGARAGDRARPAAAHARAASIHQIGLPYHWGSSGAACAAIRPTT